MANETVSYIVDNVSTIGLITLLVVGFLAAWLEQSTHKSYND